MLLASIYRRCFRAILCILESDLMRILLIGIAGTSRDLLLSIFSLKSYIKNDSLLRELVEIDAFHYKYILPEQIQAGSAEIAADIFAYKPDLLGFSTYTWNIDAIQEIIGICKLRQPEIRIILGGPEIAAEDVVNRKYDGFGADYIIFGEGEKPLRALIKSIVNNDAETLKSIPRLASYVDGNLWHNSFNRPDIDILDDLDLAPSPFLSNQIPQWLFNPKTQVNIETQRGCNFRCSYCLYHAQFPTIRYRSPIVVTDEIAYAQERGVANVRFTDANFMSNKRHAVEILSRLIERNTRMSIFFEAIPSYFDDDIADLMKTYRYMDAGNKILVGIGLQTINIESLRAIKRKLPLRHFTRAFELCSRAGAIVKTDVILGLPHETKESYLELINYLVGRMQYGYNFLSLALLRILPGSDLYGISIEAGLESDPADSQHFVYKTPTISRQDLVYCLKLNTVCYRIFHTLDDPVRLATRDHFYRTSLRTGHSSLSTLHYLVDAFTGFLTRSNPDSDFVKQDFPNAEHYWQFDVDKEIPNAFIFETLDALPPHYLDERHSLHATY